MKKIFLFLLIMFISIRVHALEMGVWTDEIANDSTIAVEDQEVRYRWYQVTTNYSSTYYIEGDNSPLYSYKSNDSIETDWSEWGEGKPADKPNRIVESKSVRRYRTLRPIRYLFLTDFSGGFIKFNISEFHVLIDGVRVYPNISCNNCSFNFNQEVSNNSIYDQSYINNGGSITIDLGANYGIDQVRLEFYMYDDVPNTKKFKLYFNEGSSIDDRNYAYKELSFYTISKDNNPERYLIMPDESFITNPVYNDWIYIDGSVNTTYYRQMQFLPFYRYKDIKYKYFNVERIYLDGYYANNDEKVYIKDKDSAKTFYTYKKIDATGSEENNKSTTPEDLIVVDPLVKDDNPVVENNTENVDVEIQPKIVNTTAVEEKIINSDNKTTEINSNDEIEASEINNDSYTPVDLSLDKVSKRKKDTNNNLDLNECRLLLFISILIILSVILLFKLIRVNLSHQK